MKRLKLTKVIASSLLVASVLALNPIGASAEWKQDSNDGWYYFYPNGSMANGGWREIDGKWYYFTCDGYMLSSRFIDGYYVNSSGQWIDVTTSGDFKFDKSTGELVGYTGNDATVTIPSTIDGVSVTSIGQFTFSYNENLKSRSWMDSTNLTSVIIPNSVKVIKRAAFENCYNLTNVIIPNSVTSIETQAFMDCYSLKSLTIPSSVTSIGTVICSGFSKENGSPYNDSVKAYYVENEKTKQLLIKSGVDESKIILNSKS